MGDNKAVIVHHYNTITETSLAEHDGRDVLFKSRYR